MGHGQVHDKLLSQVLHFTGTDADVPGGELFADFLAAAMSQEKCLAHVHQDVVPEAAARGDQRAELLRPMVPLARRTDRHRFPDLERSDVQSRHVAWVSLADLQPRVTTPAMVFFQTEVDDGRRVEQPARKQVAHHTIEVIGQPGQVAERGVFYPSLPA